MPELNRTGIDLWEDLESPEQVADAIASAFDQVRDLTDVDVRIEVEGLPGHLLTNGCEVVAVRLDEEQLNGSTFYTIILVTSNS